MKKQLPEYYTHPERFTLYYVHTDARTKKNPEGRKRVHAKSTQDARRKVESKGRKVYAVVKPQPEISMADIEECCRVKK